MESRDGMSSGITMIAPEAPSNYHVGQRTENSGPVTGTPPVAPSGISTALIVSSEKKKRGRPRKYGPDGPNAPALSPMPLSASAPPATGNFLAEKGNVPRSISSDKKQKQKMGTEKLGDWVSCSTGGNFLPHMITVNAGEDVAMKIISFSQQGPRAICVISAVGLISNVTLRQPNSSGGTLTYEGRFEILSLSGSFTPTEFGGARSRTGGMSISLASPDGRVVGGLLAGLLIAASPVQVVVGSFMPSNSHEVKPKKQKPETKLITNATSYAAITHTSDVEHNSSNAAQGLNSSATATNRNIVSSAFHQAENGARVPMANDSRKSNTDINISLQ